MSGKFKLGLALFTVIIFAIFAIASVDDNSNQSQPGNAQEKIYSLNETAELPNIKITANEIKKSKGTEFFKPDEGKIFVGVKFTIENISDKDQTISTILLFDVYADDVKCDYSVSAAVTFSEGTLDGTVSPGKKLIGYYAVEVPENTSVLDFGIKSSWLSSDKVKFKIDVPKD